GLRVNGTVDLGGAALALVGTPGAQMTLVDNDGNETVTGTFAGLIEGAHIAVGGQVFSISYVGGTGNDVVLTAVAAQSDLTIAPNQLKATYTDADGDR